ncbi:hypothetical protein B0E51_17790 [Rhodanobacter sp. C05]|nr:hypothetical protein B0E51_17790 [Rhodanobacter sp. C05]
MFAAAFLGGLLVFGKSQGHTNVDWVFVTVSFLGLLVFPSLAVGYAFTHNNSSSCCFVFARVSWWVVG